MRIICRVLFTLKRLSSGISDRDTSIVNKRYCFYVTRNYIYEPWIASNYNVRLKVNSGVRSFRETLRGRNVWRGRWHPQRVDNEIHPRNYRRPRPDRDTSCFSSRRSRNCRAHKLHSQLKRIARVRSRLLSYANELRWPAPKLLKMSLSVLILNAKDIGCS